MGFAHKESGSEFTHCFPIASCNQVQANSNSKNDFHKPLIPPNHVFPIKHNLAPLMCISPPSHICALQTSWTAQSANSNSHRRLLQWKPEKQRCWGNWFWDLSKQPSKVVPLYSRSPDLKLVSLIWFTHWPQVCDYSMNFTMVGFPFPKGASESLASWV